MGIGGDLSCFTLKEKITDLHSNSLGQSSQSNSILTAGARI